MESNKIEIAKHLILKHFSFLLTEGYSIDFEIKDDKFFSEYLIVRFDNEEKKREVSISYTKGKANEEIKYSFRARAIRTPYSNPRKDVFEISIYLRSIERDFSTTLVNQFDEQKAEEIVKKIAEDLQTYAMKIIDGTEWFEGYYARWS